MESMVIVEYGPDPTAMRHQTVTAKIPAMSGAAGIIDRRVGRGESGGMASRKNENLSFRFWSDSLLLDAGQNPH
jgi:hypothetical protein